MNSGNNIGNRQSAFTPVSPVNMPSGFWLPSVVSSSSAAKNIHRPLPNVKIEPGVQSDAGSVQPARGSMQTVWGGAQPPVVQKKVPGIPPPVVHAATTDCRGRKHLKKESLKLLGKEKSTKNSRSIFRA
eukprot:TRINITY_DN2190_c0_g1_i1.p3 TRINITY_DN2190_c0_g1~~TRINITY_DN2190_c0_g1_i1.p3  ORF type:complete len:129 (+),score=26.39 TRINITY_DN2190_c0_g1_i1:1132-1518(+)